MNLNIEELAREVVKFEGKEHCGIWSAIIEILGKYDLFDQGKEISAEIRELVEEEKLPGRRPRWIVRSQLHFSIGA